MLSSSSLSSRPVITEKSMLGAVNKIYTFEVAKSANKIEIAKACEEVFGVKVAKVNTVSMRGKFRRQGRNNGGLQYHELSCIYLLNLAYRILNDDKLVSIQNVIYIKSVYLSCFNTGDVVADLITLLSTSGRTMRAFFSAPIALSIATIFFVLYSSMLIESTTMSSFSITFEEKADFIASLLTFLFTENL